MFFTSRSDWFITLVVFGAFGKITYSITLVLVANSHLENSTISHTNSFCCCQGFVKPFACNVKRDATTESRQVVTPRHDVNAPGALVMPRPSATHQVTCTPVSKFCLSRWDYSQISFKGAVTLGDLVSKWGMRILRPRIDKHSVGFAEAQNFNSDRFNSLI